MKIIKVGLTGGIGSGKTTVAKMFGKLGAHVLDADLIVHKALLTGGEGFKKVLELFGDEVRNQDGSISKKRIADIVFLDTEKRDKLNAILHPIVRKAEMEMHAELRDGDIGITDAAMIIESGGWKRFDRIIVVDCDEPIRVARLVKRGMALDDIKRRMDAQMPLEMKLKYADFVIDNNCGEKETFSNVKEIYGKLKDLTGG